MTHDHITAKPLTAIQAYVLWKAISSSYDRPSQPIETPIMVLQGWSDLPDASLHYRGGTEEIDAVIAFLEYWADGMREHRANELKERAEEEAKRKKQTPAKKKPKAKKVEGQMMLDGMPEEPEPEETGWCLLCDEDKPVSQLKEMKSGAVVCKECLGEMAHVRELGESAELGLSEVAPEEVPA